MEYCPTHLPRRLSGLNDFVVPESVVETMQSNDLHSVIHER